MTAEPGMKCVLCRQMQTNHKEDGVWFRCEDGRVGTFKKFITDPTRRSTSFSFDELHLLSDLLLGVQTGRDLAVLLRHPSFGKITAKVTRMRKRSLAAPGKS